MDIKSIIIIVASVIGYIAVKRAWSSRREDQIEQIGKDKAKVEGKLEALEEQRDTLKTNVEKQQEHISEEGKVKFWEEYLGKKK